MSARAVVRASAIAVVVTGFVTIPTSGSSASAQAPPTYTPGSPVAVPLDLSDDPTLVATDVRAPTAMHDWVVVGDHREEAGEATGIAVYAPDDSGELSLLPSIGAAGAWSSALDVATTAAGDEIVFGQIDTDAGLRPAWWAVVGGGLTEPNTVDVAAEAAGALVAGTVADDGSLVTALRRFSPDGTSTYEMVTRAPDGTWAERDAPGIDVAAEVNAVAARGDTVVVAGAAQRDGASGTGATAWVSTDRGATFSLADTSAFSAGDATTAFRDVAAGPDGFYASVCGLPSVEGVQRFAYSADGLSWSVRRFTVAAGGIDVRPGSCSKIHVDDEGGVWLSSTTAQGYVAVYRGNGTSIGELYAMEPPPGADFVDPPAFAVSDEAVVMVQQVQGGVAAGSAARNTEFATDGLWTLVADAPGMPQLRETFQTFLEVDTAGELVAVQSYPLVTEVDGGFTTRPQFLLQRVAPDGSVTGDDEALGPLPPDPVIAARVATITAGDVAVWETLETPPADYSGPLGDLWISRRPPDGEWTGPEQLVSLVGGQRMHGLTAAGEAVIVVGQDVHPATGGGFVSTPLIVHIDAAGASRIEVPADAVGDLFAACATADGDVVALGAGGAEPLVLVVDPVARTATAAVADVEVTEFHDCASSANGEVLVAATVGDTEQLLTTPDGTTYTPVAGLSPGESVASLASGPAGLAVVGTSGAGGLDGFVLAGPDPGQLQRVDVPGLAGPGEQRPQLAVVRSDEVLVLGTDDDAPTVWPIAVS